MDRIFSLLFPDDPWQVYFVFWLFLKIVTTESGLLLYIKPCYFIWTALEWPTDIIRTFMIEMGSLDSGFNFYFYRKILLSSGIMFIISWYLQSSLLNGLTFVKRSISRRRFLLWFHHESSPIFILDRNQWFWKIFITFSFSTSKLFLLYLKLILMKILLATV